MKSIFYIRPYRKLVQENLVFYYEKWYLGQKPTYGQNFIQIGKWQGKINIFLAFLAGNALLLNTKSRPKLLNFELSGLVICLSKFTATRFKGSVTGVRVVIVRLKLSLVFFVDYCLNCSVLISINPSDFKNIINFFRLPYIAKWESLHPVNHVMKSRHFVLMRMI